MRKLIVILGAFLMSASSNAAEYSEGQVWKYRTRIGEESSTLLINKIEHDAKLGDIFHISVLGVRVRNPRDPSGITESLPHFPVSKATLNMSVTKMIGKSQSNPDYTAGYLEWKTAFDAGHAGVFSISVAEIVTSIESVVNGNGQ